MIKIDKVEMVMVNGTKKREVKEPLFYNFFSNILEEIRRFGRNTLVNFSMFLELTRLFKGFYPKVINSKPSYKYEFVSLHPKRNLTESLQLYYYTQYSYYTIQRVYMNWYLVE